MHGLDCKRNKCSSSNMNKLSNVMSWWIWTFIWYLWNSGTEDCSLSYDVVLNCFVFDYNLDLISLKMHLLFLKSSSSEKEIMHPLYDRYRRIKRLLEKMSDVRLVSLVDVKAHCCCDPLFKRPIVVDHLCWQDSLLSRPIVFKTHCFWDHCCQDHFCQVSLLSDHCCHGPLLSRTVVFKTHCCRHHFCQDP